MRGIVLSASRARLQMEERPDPTPGEGQLRVKISTCGVCRTDLHLVDAEMADIRYPIAPGHGIVGRVDLVGPNVATHALGDRSRTSRRARPGCAARRVQRRAGQIVGAAVLTT